MGEMVSVHSSTKSPVDKEEEFRITIWKELILQVRPPSMKPIMFEQAKVNMNLL
jgi:hypothetical protein